jgi:hypothetical protein
MNTTQYNDATLQAAIDVSFNESIFGDTRHSPAWGTEAPARLSLARALLARLPEPTPPTADGKTPGQVSAEAQAKLDYVHNMGLRFGMMNSSDKPEPYLSHFWTDDSDHERMFREWSASIGGQTSLEAGIKRMEAVPEGELLKDYVDALDDELHSFEDRDEPLTTNAIRGFGIEAVRARLIAAAKEEQP